MNCCVRVGNATEQDAVADGLGGSSNYCIGDRHKSSSETRAGYAIDSGNTLDQRARGLSVKKDGMVE